MSNIPQNSDVSVANLDSGNPFESVNGEIRFDEVGVRLPVFALQILENGELVDLAS